MKPQNINSPDNHLFKVFFWILVCGVLLIFFWGIWSIPLLSNNEGRRLAVLREMLVNHEWLLPYMNGELYLEKPPLFTWIGGIFALLFNSTAEWVMRLPSGLSAVGIIGLIYFRVKKYVGPWAASYGILVLITSYFFTHHARLAEIEMLLTFCIFAAVLFYYDYLMGGQRYFLYISYIFLGLAFMTKGPVALLFFLPPILVYWFATKDINALKGLLDWHGWLLFSTIAFPWFIYIIYYFHIGPLLSIFNVEVSGAVAATKGKDPFYAYLIYLVAYLFPWVLVLFWKPHISWKHFTKKGPALYFSITALIPLLIYSLFYFKRNKYILPIYPAVAVWLGIAMDYWVDKYKERWQRLPVVIISIGGFMIALCFIYHSIIEPRVRAYSFEAFKPLASQLDTLRGTAPVYFFEQNSMQLVYYYGQPIPVVNKDMVVRMLGEGRSFLLLAMGDKHPQNIQGLNLCLIDTISPYESPDENLYVLGSGSPCRKDLPSP